MPWRKSARTRSGKADVSDQWRGPARHHPKVRSASPSVRCLEERVDTDGSKGDLTKTSAPAIGTSVNGFLDPVRSNGSIEGDCR